MTVLTTRFSSALRRVAASNTNAKRARQRLSLPQTPDVRVDLEVPKGVFGPPSPVRPQYGMTDVSLIGREVTLDVSDPWELTAQPEILDSVQRDPWVGGV